VPGGEQPLLSAPELAERARRTEALQRAESEFDPVPFDAEAARIYGRVTAAVAAADRTPRRRIAGLMIAATAIAEGLPLVTTNPGDYAGLEKLVLIVPVTRPSLPHEKTLRPRLSASGLAWAGGGAVPRRQSGCATGCSAAWLARVLWVLRGRSVKSDRDCRADVGVRCARVQDSNDASGFSLETPGCAETVASDTGWCRSLHAIRMSAANWADPASPGTP